MKKYVYEFEEGNIGMKDLLGGKGAGLAEMASMGLPVPPGFTITTEACREYLSRGDKFLKEIEGDVRKAIERLERKTGKKFGGKENPLLLSVRSGAKFSMPGMMDTVLNLGLNDSTVQGLISQSANERFAYDAYRRFLMMFGDIVLKIDRKKFEEIFEGVKKEIGARYDVEVDAENLKKVVQKFKELIRRETGKDFPQDPWEQLWLAIKAVFESWNNPRAVTYRNAYNIPHDLGTACNIQTMVFGNFGEKSGTGVGFTRDPSTGENKLYGEYLMNAQGEDVVAGIRTPKKIDEMKKEMPEVYEQLIDVRNKLESHFKDMQDFEFTIENGKLYMLQTRTGKRTAMAAVKIAVDMAKEGLISKEEALMRVDPSELNKLLHPMIDPSAKVEVVAKGLPASPGTACGKVVFDADRAVEEASKGEKVILVRPETTPDDIHGMIAAQGILTSHGGMTSHAAVVARGMGKPCVCGCEEIRVDLDRREFSVKGKVVREGDTITIDGSSGGVILGKVPMIQPKLSGEVEELLKWADEFRKLEVWANADLPVDARRAREFGAQGIGLCRTEHMFFAPDRLPIVQQMIMAESADERKKYLDKLFPIQKEDFKGIFREMHGLPVIIRLLDPPLHEFLPRLEDLLVEVTELRIRGDGEKLREKEEMLKRVRALHEANPMLGLRVCRLGIVYPEIYEMQVKAILSAALEVKREGIDVKPEIMIPGTSHVNEMKFMRDLVDRVAKDVLKGEELHYKVGTMMEMPRACLTADEIARYAEFFSFGTNDLTQTVFGYSRDDAERSFLPAYLDKGILDSNPFATLDWNGVGKLMKMAIELGRKTRKDLHIGICGEHGGDPKSIEFCHMVGLNYVSCSPFRVPIARLAAAQAAIRGRKEIRVSDQR